MLYIIIFIVRNSEMSSSDQKKQLRDLVHIVLGIRLFNKNVNKGGAGLIDCML